MDILGTIGSVMSGQGNGKRMFGVGLLTVLMMSAAGCTELMEEVNNALEELDIDFYLGTTSNVTLEIYHGESLASATANYTITIELDHVLAPLHADNFRTHAIDGNYNNVTFHRIIDDFMIQGGDFTNGDGTGGHAAKWYGICNGLATDLSECSSELDYNVPDEADNGLKHYSCTISMAKLNYPDTGGSQFFLVPEDSTPDHLDGVHTVFGKISSGCDHVTAISQVAVSGPQGSTPVNDVTIESTAFIGQVETKPWYKFW